MKHLKKLIEKKKGLEKRIKEQKAREKMFEKRMIVEEVKKVAEISKNVQERLARELKVQEIALKKKFDVELRDKLKGHYHKHKLLLKNRRNSLRKSIRKIVGGL